MGGPRSFAAPASCFVRSVSARYPECLRTGSAPIDVDRAIAQHAGYVEVLRRLGLRVERVPPIEEAPDAVFVEDTAVVVDRRVLATRPGAPSRRAEVESVAQALSDLVPVVTMEAPATLDGGDVLRVGERLFVGRSERTNEAGIEVLRALAAEEGLDVCRVEVEAGLHLKSAVTLVDPRTVVYDAGGLDPAPFREAGLACVEALEPEGANVLALGASVLVSAAAPKTAARLRQRGVAVVEVDVGELHKGDGALTCLSIRIPAPGTWVT